MLEMKNQLVDNVKTNVRYRFDNTVKRGRNMEQKLRDGLHNLIQGGSGSVGGATAASNPAPSSDPKPEKPQVASREKFVAIPLVCFELKF